MIVEKPTYLAFSAKYGRCFVLASALSLATSLAVGRCVLSIFKLIDQMVTFERQGSSVNVLNTFLNLMSKGRYGSQSC